MSTSRGEVDATCLRIASFAKKRGKGGSPASVRISMISSQVMGFWG